MQPETAFWFLSAIAQAGAALTGLAVVGYVFTLRRTREDLQAAQSWASRRERLGRLGVVKIHGLRRSKPLAWAARLYLAGVTLALSALLFVGGEGPVSWGVEALAYVALAHVVAGNVGLVLFLRQPWPYVLDQVGVTDAGKFEVQHQANNDEEK